MDEEDIQRTARLMTQESYTLSQLAELLQMQPYVLEEAIYRGELKAQLVGKDIVRIRRADALEWLRQRG